MDSLARFIVERIKCMFHPYIPKDSGWRRYPPHVAKTLEFMEPIHIIAVTPAWVGADGVRVDDSRGMHDKFNIILETTEAIFGDTVEITSGGNLELRILSTGLSALCFFQGSIWYLAICADLRPYPSRFAFLADSSLPCARNEYTGEKSTIASVVATVDGVKVSFKTSPKFFLDPKPENVELFGDMLFLAQMRGGWIINKKIQVSFGSDWRIDTYEYIAFVLKDCPGVESVLKHAYTELVLNDSDEDTLKWRSLARAIEKQLQGKHVMQGEVNVPVL